MNRPTLHLTNWSSRSQRGQGRRLCAMAAPRQWEHGDGRVDRCAPTLTALRLVQATGDLAGYRAILDDRWKRSDAGTVELRRLERAAAASALAARRSR